MPPNVPASDQYIRVRGLPMITAFVPPTLAVLYRIRVEEAALMGAFGNEYEEYRQATKRLIPGLY